MTERQTRILTQAYEGAKLLGRRDFPGLVTKRKRIYRYKVWTRLLESSGPWAALHPRERADLIGEEVREAWTSGIIDGLHERRRSAAEGGHGDPAWLL